MRSPMEKNGAHVRCRLVFCSSLSLSYVCKHRMVMIAPHRMCAYMRAQLYDKLEPWSASLWIVGSELSSSV